MSLTASFRNMQLPDRQCRDRQDIKDKKEKTDVAAETGDQMEILGRRLFFICNHFIGRNSADYMKNQLLTNKKK